MARSTLSYTFRALAVAIAAWCAIVAAPFDADGGALAPPRTPIAVENAQRGSRDWEPLEPNGHKGEIEGYASQVSVSPGGLLQLHVSTRPAARYQVQVLRLGWYGGQGGRFVTCLPSCQKYLKGRPQPIGGSFEFRSSRLSFA